MTQPIDLDDIYDEQRRADEQGDHESHDYEQGAYEEADRRFSAPGLKALIGFCVLIIVGLAGLVGYMVVQRLSPAEEDTAPAAVATSPATAPTRRGSSVLEPFGRAAQSYNEFMEQQQRRQAEVEQEPPSTPEPAEFRQQRATNYTAGRGSEEVDPAQLVLERRLAGTLPTENRNAGASAAGNYDGSQAGQGEPFLAASFGGGGNNSNAELGGLLNPSTTRSARASMVANPSLTLAKGQSIPCGTTSELDTTVPGMISCQISRDIYSMDNSVVLIDKGSTAIGTVQGGISQGQARVFALWEDIRTPHHVHIPLNSPGTNRLGSSGIPGQVDTHFWERFGAAIMFSVLSDAGSAVVNAANEGTATVELSSTASSSQALAQEALRNNINIPPTLYVSHGENVSIFVARDVDFSDVYGLESINGRH